MAYRLPKIIFDSEDYFIANISSPIGNVTGNGNLYSIIFDSVIENKLGNYDNTTGVFTCSLTGLYSFSVTIAVDNGVSAFNGGGFKFIFNGSVYSFVGNLIQLPATSSTWIMSKEIVLPMTAGDTLGIQVQVDGGPADSFNLWGQAPQGGIGAYDLTTMFSGYKIY